MFKESEGKAEIRAWLYELLARLEYADDAEGERIENPGGKVVIKVQLKS